jgi:hypothetical protein
MQALQIKYETEMKSIREEMHHNFKQIVSITQQNPLLNKIKPEVLSNKAIEKRHLFRDQE